MYPNTSTIPPFREVEQVSSAPRTDESILPLSCAQQEHDWQPTTIIIGYYQCSRCSALAACRACVSTVRGSAIVGLCRAHHQQLGVPLAQHHQEDREEVLG